MITFIRTIILFLLVVATMRLMGKRQVGELQPFELVTAIMISDLATVPMQNMGIPLLQGVIPILTMLFLNILISFLSMKNTFFQKIVSGKPVILVEKGKIIENALRKEFLTLSDLMEQFRNNGVASVSEVEWAIIETNGKLSVIKKDTSPENNLPVNVVIDGKIVENSLRFRKKDEKWLTDELKKKGINDYSNIFFALLEADETLVIQMKEKDRIA